MVVEGAPDLVVVVDRDRVVDPSLLRRLPHAVDLVLERELRRVDADDDQPVVPVGLATTHGRTARAQPVDARQRPEVHEDDAAAQLGRVERLGVEPRDRAAERGHVQTVELGHRPWRTAAKWSCTSWTAIAPSPTAVAQRFVDPERTSPAAKIPGTLVSSRLSVPAAEPVRMKPCLVALRPRRRATRCTEARRGRGRGTRTASRSPLFSVTASSLPSSPCSSAISLRSRTATPAAVELANQVVGHRLAQVGAAVEQRHERAAAREPDRGLARGVAAADDGDARGAAAAVPRAGLPRRRRSAPRSPPDPRPGAADTARRSRG